MLLSSGPEIAPPSTPSEYAILTNGVAVTITTNRPATIKANGVTIGSTAGSPATLSWTPSSNGNVSLTATAGGVTSAARKVTVAAANPISSNVASWAASNVTVSSAQTEPGSGRTYYRVTCNSSTGSHFVMSGATGASQPNGSFDITLRTNGGTGWVGLQIASGPNVLLWINVNTGEAYGQLAAGGIVERYSDGFVRVQGHVLNGDIVESIIVYVNAVVTANSVSVTSTTTGVERVDIAAPRTIDATVALPDALKFQAVFETTTAEGIKRYTTSTPYADSVATMNAVRGRLDVLVPSTYDPTKNYQAIICLGVEATPGNVYAAELPIIATNNLHNTKNVIVCQWANRTSQFPWWGAKNTGDNDYEKVIIGQIIPWLRSNYNIFAGREGIALLGWSKGAWGALSLALRNPAQIGFVGIWDVDWNEVYGPSDSGGVDDYGESTFFGTSGQFDLYNPKTIYAANKTAAFGDKRRIHLSGAARFNTDVQDLHTQLTTDGIQHDYFYANANDVGTGGANHNANFGWIEGTNGAFGSAGWLSYGGPSLFARLCALMQTGFS